MIKFAIRDDDTNFFTNFSDIEAIYGNIWERIPVSLAVVPFQAAIRQKRIPQEYWNSPDLFPVGNNKSLINNLQDGILNGQISVMQHGYSHGDKVSSYEFRDGTNLLHKAKEGRAYLEELFVQPIKVFVPPHNSFSRKGFSAVVDTGFNIAGIPSFHPSVRRWRINYIFQYLKYKSFTWRYRNQSLQYPWVLKFPDHKEKGFYGLVSGVTFKSLKHSFDYTRSMQGSSYCLSTHYWELLEKPKLHDILLQFVSYACSYCDCSPQTVTEIFEE
jgi:hypothetical protein